MDTNARIFLNPKSDNGAVLHAISQMSTSGVPANLWTQVANDPSYRPFHRAVAVHELFKWHITEPVTLKQLALLLAGGRWLLQAAIEKIELFGGETPIQIPAGGTGFVIRLPKDPTLAYPDIGMYLALDGALDAKLLRDVLMLRATDPAVGQISMVDFALFPESLKGRDALKSG